MQDLPPIEHLTDIVCDFLETRVSGALTGHDAFHLRVAINILRLAERAARLSQPHEAHARARLQALLDTDETDLRHLNQVFAEALRTGRLGLDNPAVQTHLIKATMGKLAIDQPRYAGYLRAQARGWDEEDL